MTHTHYEVWHWPDGGAPLLPPTEDDTDPQSYAVGFPEDEDDFSGRAILTETEAAECLKAWEEYDPEGEYRIVKVTYEVLDVAVPKS